MHKGHKTLNRDQHRQIIDRLSLAGNQEDIVLRGHLYVEYWLNEMILKEWKKGDIIVGNFTFSQKVSIAESTGLVSDGDIEVIACLREINAIRNRFAHDLYPDEIEGKFNKLSVPFNTNPEGLKHLTGIRRFQLAVAVVSAYMLGRCETKDNITSPDSLLPALLLSDFGLPPS